MILGHLTFTTQVSPSFIDLSNYVNFQIGKKNRWTQKTPTIALWAKIMYKLIAALKVNFRLKVNCKKNFLAGLLAELTICIFSTICFKVQFTLT